MTMSWLWIAFPALVAIGLFTLSPLLSRRGFAPFPAGLEGDPFRLLEEQKALLLRQIKALEVEGETSGDLRAGLEGRLARILGQLDELKTIPEPEPRAPASRNPTDIAAGAALLIGLTALVWQLYGVLGTPFPPSGAVVAGSGPSSGDRANIDVMVDRLADRLRDAPDDLGGWMRLGRSYHVLGKTNQAMAAFSHILERDPQNLDAAAGLGGILVESADSGQFNRGIQIFMGILDKDPDHPEALWVMGIAAFQSDRPDMALPLWRRLQAQAPPDSPMGQEVARAIRHAEGLLAQRGEGAVTEPESAPSPGASQPAPGSGQSTGLEPATPPGQLIAPEPTHPEPAGESGANGTLEVN